MRFRVPASVGWVQGADVLPHDENIYLLAMPDGVPAVLEGNAATIWLLAAEGAHVRQSVAEMVGDEVERLFPDIETFLADLVAQGLLEPLGED